MPMYNIKLFIKKQVVENKFRTRLITKSTTSTFQQLLSNETWDDIYIEHDIDDNFNLYPSNVEYMVSC
jgi:hypothetical protein